MKRIMVRADDLGYSEAVNYGIEKSVKNGIIKNIGFMVNMPASEHGYHLIKDEDVCIGLHTNICVGRPLCDPNLIPSIVQENGEFVASKTYRNSETDLVVLDEVILEIEAQYQRFKEITGREPAYFEGHAIESDNFQRGLQIVAERHGLKFCGTSFDGSPIIVNNQKMYMHMESMLPNYDPVQTIKNIANNNHEDGFDMIIFHPGYLDAYIMRTSSLLQPRTLEVEAACSEELKTFLTEEQIHLYTYDEV